MTAQLAALLRHESAGDPCSDLRWIRRTTRNLADYLTAELDRQVSPRTVARLLRAMGYSLRVNSKCLPSTSRAERNAQFEVIAGLRPHCTRHHTPAISIDPKKNELGGSFRNPGTAWEPQPVAVNDHDFHSQADGLAIPQGIYDPLSNRGCVRFGISSDTAFFAFDNLVAWCRLRHHLLQIRDRCGSLPRLHTTPYLHDSGQNSRSLCQLVVRRVTPPIKNQPCILMTSHLTAPP